MRRVCAFGLDPAQGLPHDVVIAVIEMAAFLREHDVVLVVTE